MASWAANVCAFVLWALILVGIWHAVSAQTANQPSWMINQARCAVLVTPSDTADLPPAPGICSNAPSKGIYTSGTAGGAACTLVMSLQDGVSQTWVNVQPGAVIPAMVRRVYAADQGTTCSGILALY